MKIEKIFRFLFVGVSLSDDVSNQSFFIAQERRLSTRNDIAQTRIGVSFCPFPRIIEMRLRGHQTSRIQFEHILNHDVEGQISIMFILRNRPRSVRTLEQASLLLIFQVESHRETPTKTLDQFGRASFPYLLHEQMEMVLVQHPSEDSRKRITLRPGRRAFESADRRYLATPVPVGMRVIQVIKGANKIVPIWNIAHDIHSSCAAIRDMNYGINTTRIDSHILTIPPFVSKVRPYSHRRKLHERYCKLSKV